MVQNMVDEQMRQAIFWTICWIDGIVVNLGKLNIWQQAHKPTGNNVLRHKFVGLNHEAKPIIDISSLQIISHD